MHFSRSFFLALVSVVLAQDSGDQPNPFTLNQSFSPAAGQPSTITWTPTTDGTISLYLRDGNGANLNTGTLIATGLPNSGSYTWDVPSDAVRCSQCTIEIVDDSDPDEMNYSGRFILSSDNNAAPSSSTSVTSASSSSASSSNTQSTAPLTPSAFPLDPTITINTNPPSSVSTSATTTGPSSSSSETATTTSETSSSDTTPTPSGSDTPTSSGADLVATTNTDNAAPRATAMIGMLGAVALGALAL